MSSINIEGWFHGCKVRIFEWIDKKNIYVNCQYYCGGDRIGSPRRDESFLLPLSNLETVRNNTDSVVNALMFTDAGNQFRISGKEPVFTDAEHRILLSAMSRERKICEEVNKESGTVDLVALCRSIERKIYDLQHCCKEIAPV